MDDNEVMPLVSRELLVKRGISAVTCLAGGIFLLIMAMGAKGLFGIVFPCAALVFGIGALLSKDSEAGKPGFFLASAGVLGMLVRFVPVIRPLGGTLLGLGALGLIAMGIWQGVRFFLGLKSRA